MYHSMAFLTVPKLSRSRRAFGSQSSAVIARVLNKAYHPKLKDQTSTLPGYFSTVVHLQNLDIDSRHPEEIAGHRDEMLWETAWHIIQRPHHQRCSHRQNQASHRSGLMMTS